MEIATLGLGCFWGPEIKFNKLEGVVNTEVGYCGGNTEQTTYKEVCYGNTNHAEVVKIEFDDTKISYEDILRYFFEFHDPTTLNRQGPDVGTQYRSEIFVRNEDQNKIASKILNEFNEKFEGKIVTKFQNQKIIVKQKIIIKNIWKKTSNVYSFY